MLQTQSSYSTSTASSSPHLEVSYLHGRADPVLPLTHYYQLSAVKAFAIYWLYQHGLLDLCDLRCYYAAVDMWQRRHIGICVPRVLFDMFPRLTPSPAVTAARRPGVPQDEAERDLTGGGARD